MPIKQPLTVELSIEGYRSHVGERFTCKPVRDLELRGSSGSGDVDIEVEINLKHLLTDDAIRIVELAEKGLIRVSIEIPGEGE